MAGLVSISSFSSLYDLVSSPLRPSSPVDYHLPVEAASYQTPAAEARLHHDSSPEEHSTPRQALQRLHSTSNSPLAHAQEPELQLTTACEACGNVVVMKMPSWLSKTRAEYEQSMWEAQMARQTCEHEQVGPSRRDRVVAIAVGGAKAFRESPLPGLLLLMLKTLVALCFYLDQRFALRERGMRVFWSIIADLQYVEKETGMMRQSGETIGEWLSVIWEACVKGAIALANPDVAMRAGQFDRRGATPHRSNTSHAPPSSYDHDSHYTHHNSFPFPSSAMPFEYSTPRSYPASPPNLRQYASTSTSTAHSSSSSSYLQQPFAYQSQSRGHHVPLTPDESDGDDEGTSDYLDHESSTSSSNTTIPGHSFTSPKKRRTLRRMANSVPSFHLAGASGETSGRSSGVSSPDGRHGGYVSPTPGRPRMPRQRSRSGPDETTGSATKKRAGESLQVPVGGQGRGGWVAQTMAGVVGRVL